MKSLLESLSLPHLILYLAVVNLLGFIFYMLNLWCKKHFEKLNLDPLLVFIAILLGSGGELIALLLYDRKAIKANLMMHTFLVVIFIIEVFLGLGVWAIAQGNAHNGFASLFQNSALWIYLLIINFITLLCFGLDKFLAVHQKSRIPNLVLLGLAFFGGSIGALAGMQLFHHKTKKNYYVTGVPLMMVMQLLIIAYFYFLY